MPPRGVLACADGPYDLLGNALLDPEVVAGKEWAPFYYTANRPFFTDNEQSNDAHTLDALNLEEWASFFEGQVKPAAWKEFMEQGTADSLWDLASNATNGSLASALTDPRDPAARKKLAVALRYLALAKRVEQIVPRRKEPWDFDETPDPVDQLPQDFVAGLFTSATNGAEESGYDFLKQRYTFLAVKVLFYRKQYEECAQYYDDHRPLLDGGSIGWRAMGYSAGSLYKLKRYAESNYQYSLIYDGCPELRLSAYWSFHPQEEADWQQCLALASSPREKAVLWHMMGIQQDGLRAMPQIYALDPASDLLDILLAREVNKIEQDVDLEGRRDSDSVDTARKRLEALTAFVDDVARAENTRIPHAWTLVDAHLHAMQRDTAKALDLFDDAERMAPDRPDVARQARLGRTLARVMALEDPRAMPQELADDLFALKEEAKQEPTEDETPMGRSGTLLGMALSRLSQQFQESGDPYMALYLDEYGGNNYKFKSSTQHDPVKLQHMIAFLDRPDKSPIEKLAAGTFPYDSKDLQEVLAMNELYAGRPEKAAERFSRSKSATLPGDPFVIHIQDCHDCDHAAPKKRSYTKLDLARRLVELDTKARSGQEGAAAAYFDLANAYYNISYYGNARMMYQSAYDSLEDDPRVKSTDRALKYYLLAMKSSKDPEFRAKCCFMAAKCEQAARINGLRDPWDQVVIPTNYFKEFAGTYAKTRYYQEVLRECGYFRRYAGTRQKRP